MQQSTNEECTAQAGDVVGFRAVAAAVAALWQDLDDDLHRAEASTPPGLYIPRCAEGSMTRQERSSQVCFSLGLRLLSRSDVA